MSHKRSIMKELPRKNANYTESNRSEAEGIIMAKNNYFVEGLQGAGKTTFVQRLSENLTDYTVFREGDFSPVELAWCAYVTEEQYNNILKDYPSLKEEIIAKTVIEDEHRIICYTQILTDVPNFHRNLEKYEIYNGNLARESFENVIFGRFKKWNEEGPWNIGSLMRFLRKEPLLSKLRIIYLRKLWGSCSTIIQKEQFRYANCKKIEILQCVLTQNPRHMNEVMMLAY